MHQNWLLNVVIMALNLGLLPMSFAVAAQSFSRVNLLDVEVIAHPTKATGAPWDGRPDVTVVLPPILPGVSDRVFTNITESPPDLEMWIVNANGQRVPYRAPYCLDSRRCLFRAVPVPVGVFGVLVVDRDVNNHDYVDGVIFLQSPTEKCTPERKQLDIALRRLADEVCREPQGLSAIFKQRSPLIPSEFPVRVLTECSADVACGLSQSMIGLSQTKIESCLWTTTFALQSLPPVVAGERVNLAVHNVFTECPGGLGFLWDFGDAAETVSAATTAVHTYS